MGIARRMVLPGGAGLMAVVCPTILAPTPEIYDEQLKRVLPFAKRIQVDISDGMFAPTKTINVSDAHWPEGVQADLHMMVNDPGQYMHDFIRLQPNMVILHAEAEDSARFGLERVFEQVKLIGIKIGLALLPDTSVESQRGLLEMVDHILIFSGALGHFGGQVRPDLLIKAGQAKVINPALEIGWDGGINDKTAPVLLAGGVSVLNVGGYIHKSENPANAYAILEQIINPEKKR